MDGTSSSTVQYNSFIETFNASQLLSDSIQSTSAKGANLLITKTYKKASALFLTRQLFEAFATIEPIVFPSHADETAQSDVECAQRPLIAGASRKIRIKVWTFYLTLLNAIINLGPENGKDMFGSKAWKKLVAKARDGTIWEDVVQIGYHGIEGNVDAEVVINLAILLLAQSPLQVKNQQRLESYLSVSSLPIDHSANLFEFPVDDPVEWQAHPSVGSGPGTTQDLSSRIKIMELYTLHVLPRNEHWQDAKDFIAISEVLDEETREAFSVTLQSIQAERNRNLADGITILTERNSETRRDGEPTEHRQLDAPPSGQSMPGTFQASGGNRRSNRDYGIEEASTGKGETKPTNNVNLQNAQPPDRSRTKLSPTIRPSSTSKNPATKGVYTRGVAMLVALQDIVHNVTQSMSQNPMILLRTIMFLVSVILAFSRRDVKDRISRITGIGWEKVRGTVGMGVKVSYI